MIVNVTLNPTDFGWEWSERTEQARVRFVGRPHDGRQFSPWPLLGHEPVARLHQVHSSSVASSSAATIVPADGLVSDREIGLLIATADCVPVLLTDGSKAIAVHAGWRGMVGDIVARARAALSARGPILAWIGPHIESCCYEVGPEVAEQMPRFSQRRTDSNQPKIFLDLKAAAFDQLDIGPEDRVIAIDCCTHCHASKLWSYRRDPACGRNLAVICLNRSE